MEGPTSEYEAQQAQAELIVIRERHAAYCQACLDKQPCPMGDTWAKAIAAAAVLAETARVVDGNDAQG